MVVRGVIGVRGDKGSMVVGTGSRVGEGGSLGG